MKTPAVLIISILMLAMPYGWAQTAPPTGDSTRADTLKMPTPEKSVSQSLYAARMADTTQKHQAPTTALFQSLLIPGWGQIGNGKYIKAGLIIGAELALLYGIIRYADKAADAKSAFEIETDPTLKLQLYYDYSDYEDSRDKHKWYLGTVIFLSMFDAFVDAHLADFPRKDNRLTLDFTPTPVNLFGVTLSYNF